MLSFLKILIMVFKGRKVMIYYERVFADAKENHGFRYTRLRGLKKNQHQALMLFASHHLKKIGIWNRKLKELYPSGSLNIPLILRFWAANIEESVIHNKKPIFMNQIVHKNRLCQQSEAWLSSRFNKHF